MDVIGTLLEPPVKGLSGTRCPAAETRWQPLDTCLAKPFVWRQPLEDMFVVSHGELGRFTIMSAVVSRALPTCRRAALVGVALPRRSAALVPDECSLDTSLGRSERYLRDNT